MDYFSLELLKKIQILAKNNNCLIIKLIRNANTTKYDQNRIKLTTFVCKIDHSMVIYYKFDLNKQQFGLKIDFLAEMCNF